MADLHVTGDRPESESSGTEQRNPHQSKCSMPCLGTNPWPSLTVPRSICSRDRELWVRTSSFLQPGIPKTFTLSELSD